MRHLIAPALLSLVCGCYLFSDEPKVRKHAEDVAVETPPPSDAKAPNSETPAVDPATDEAACPQILTGVEAQPRTIASSCTSVRVRGQYVIDGGSLTVAAGVELRFEPGAVLEVGRDRPGQLRIEGTPEQPVRMIADSISDSGQWLGVRLHAQAGGSSLRNVEISGARTNEHAVLWLASHEVTVEGVNVRTTSGRALELAIEQAPSLVGVTLTGVGPIVRASPPAVGGLQDVKLEPGAWVEVGAGTITSTIEWPPNTYRIDNVVRVEGPADRPAQLSLSNGTELRFGPDGRVVIGGLGAGSLIASAPPRPDPAMPQPPDAVPQHIRMIAAEGELPGSWSGLLVQDNGQLWLRNVELAHGGARDEGVIVAEGSASLNLDGLLLRSNLVGVELRGSAVKLEGFDNCEFVATPAAIRTTPTLLGKLGPNNRYDAEARIDVERGKLETDATWAAQGAPIVVHGDVFVDKGATLKVSPGAALSFDAGVNLAVGYYEQATLDMRGTADLPITLGPAPVSAGEQPQPWGGVVLGAHAHKSRFEYVALRQTGNPAAIELRDTADATLVNVRCAACAGAVVKWDCKSTVGNVGVGASEGTPTTMIPPSDCN